MEMPIIATSIANQSTTKPRESMDRPILGSRAGVRARPIQPSPRFRRAQRRFRDGA
jgi:hypothetical protein